MDFWLLFSICISFLPCFGSELVNRFCEAPKEVIWQIINDSVPEYKADTCLSVIKKMALVDKNFYNFVNEPHFFNTLLDTCDKNKDNIHSFSKSVRQFYFENLIAESLDHTGPIGQNFFNWLLKKGQNFDDRMLFLTSHGLSPQYCTEKMYKSIGSGFCYETDFGNYIFYDQNITSDKIFLDLNQLPNEKPIAVFRPGKYNQTNLLNLVIKNNSSLNFFDTIESLNFPNFIVDSKDHNFYTACWIKEGNPNTVTLYMGYSHAQSVMGRNLKSPFGVLRWLNKNEKEDFLKQCIKKIKSKIKQQIQNSNTICINTCFESSNISYIQPIFNEILNQTFSNSRFKIQRTDHENYGNVSDIRLAEKMLTNLSTLLESKDYNSKNILHILQYLEGNIFVPSISELYCDNFLDTRGSESKKLLKLYLLLYDCFKQKECSINRLIRFILLNFSLERFTKQINNIPPSSSFNCNPGDQFEAIWSIIMNTEEKKRFNNILQENDTSKLINLLCSDLDEGFKAIQQSTNTVFSFLKGNDVILPSEEKDSPKKCAIFFDSLSLALQFLEKTLINQKKTGSNKIKSLLTKLMEIVKVEYSNIEKISEYHPISIDNIQSIKNIKNINQNRKFDKKWRLIQKTDRKINMNYSILLNKKQKKKRKKIEINNHFDLDKFISKHVDKFLYPNQNEENISSDYNSQEDAASFEDNDKPDPFTEKIRIFIKNNPKKFVAGGFLFGLILAFYSEIATFLSKNFLPLNKPLLYNKLVHF